MRLLSGLATRYAPAELNRRDWGEVQRGAASSASRRLVEGGASKHVRRVSWPETLVARWLSLKELHQHEGIS